MDKVAPNNATLFTNHWNDVAGEMVDNVDPFQLIIGLAGAAFTIMFIGREPVLQPFEFTIVSVKAPVSVAV